MKSIKFGFATVIALLAIGLTIAAQAGVFSKKVVAAQDFCYQSDVLVRDVCTNATVTLVQGELGWDCEDLAPYLNAHIFSPNLTIDQTDKLNRITEAPSVCPGGEKFCCFEVIVDTAPCVPQSQPTIVLDGTSNKFIISNIRCKTFVD